MDIDSKSQLTVSPLSNQIPVVVELMSPGSSLVELMAGFSTLLICLPESQALSAEVLHHMI